MLTVATRAAFCANTDPAERIVTKISDINFFILLGINLIVIDYFA